MLNDQERNQLNQLKNEIEAKENFLKAEQYIFEQKLKSGLGEEINYTLSNCGIYNSKEKSTPKIITIIKTLFNRDAKNNNHRF
jgi:hypothetical protein